MKSVQLTNQGSLLKAETVLKKVAGTLEQVLNISLNGRTVAMLNNCGELTLAMATDLTQESWSFISQSTKKYLEKIEKRQNRLDILRAEENKKDELRTYRLYNLC